MTHIALRRHTLPLACAAVAAGGALSSQHVKGPTVNERWGTVQISIVVKNKKNTNVKPSVSMHTTRSKLITDGALPLLKQEVLQVQNASIGTVSGAADLNEAYLTSLQSTVNKALKAKVLQS